MRASAHSACLTERCTERRDWKKGSSEDFVIVREENLSLKIRVGPSPFLIGSSAEILCLRR